MYKFIAFCLILSVLCEIILCDSSRVLHHNKNESNNNNEHKIDERIDYNCTENLTGNFGKCKLVTDCPEIIKKIKKGQTNHTICGYQKLQQIVCCPTISTELEKEPTSKCFNPLSQSKYIEVVGETCTDQVSGRQGKYRWTPQCPYHLEDISISSLLYSCCIPVVCCPDLGIIPSSIHEHKCLDYSKSVYEGKWEIEGPYTSKQVGNCPSFIFGGTIVTKGEFPFMAALGFQKTNGNFSYDCGGTLISDRYILTAGHCLSSQDLGPVKIARLGAISLNASAFDNNFLKDYKIIQRIPHPKYTIKSQYNDIGLLLLEKPVEISRYVRPACLPSSVQIPQLLTAMGWGITEIGARSQNLLKIHLQLFSHAKCNDSYIINRKLHLGIVDETQVCAGSIDSNKDTCQGDSGGPLVAIHTNLHSIHNLMGITSLGRSCGSAGIPGVYTRVFPYIKWIESIVWPATI